MLTEHELGIIGYDDIEDIEDSAGHEVDAMLEAVLEADPLLSTDLIEEWSISDGTFGADTDGDGEKDGEGLTAWSSATILNRLKLGFRNMDTRSVSKAGSQRIALLVIS